MHKINESGTSYAWLLLLLGAALKYKTAFGSKTLRQKKSEISSGATDGRRDPRM